MAPAVTRCGTPSARSVSLTPVFVHRASSALGSIQVRDDGGPAAGRA